MRKVEEAARADGGIVKLFSLSRRNAIKKRS